MKRTIVVPQRFTLQWPITDACNLNCKHCYRGEKPLPEPTLFQLKQIFSQYLRLLEFFRIPRHASRLHLYGGEPLLSKNFFPLLEHIYRFRHRFRLGILTNGTLVSPQNAQRLKSLGVEYVQISLEGMQANNDAVRGAGNFEKAMRAIDILVRAGLKANVSLTITKKNRGDLDPLLSLCERKKVYRFAGRRLLPSGKASLLRHYLLSPGEQKEIYEWREKKRVELRFKQSDLHLWYECEDGIIAREALGPLRRLPESRTYCRIIEGELLAVLSNGDVLPCRLLPIKIGNVFKEELLEILLSSKILLAIRDRRSVHSRCKQCEAFPSCIGGARCLSYAHFKNLNAPDPRCWRLFKRDSLPPRALRKTIGET